MSATIELVLGGARCGKSDWAVARARQSGGDVLFVATAEADDEDMRARIEAHRQERPGHWRTIEEPVDVTARLESLGRRYDVVVIDCMTLLVSNWLIAGSPDRPVRPSTRVIAESPDPPARGSPRAGGEASIEAIAAGVTALCRALRSCCRLAIVVSNEVGSGIVPRHALARRFRDDLGAANRRLAEEADRVYLLVAGLPLTLKDEEPAAADAELPLTLKDEEPAAADTEKEKGR